MFSLFVVLNVEAPVFLCTPSVSEWADVIFLMLAKVTEKCAQKHTNEKLRFMGTPPCFSVILSKGDFLFVYRDINTIPKGGSSFKGKNLLLQDQILSFKSRPYS